ncbi:MAG: hypothetical protein B193_1937 [Solidesulfovibrio magneticus str. Maddingley MBC34]|uniref:Uncharacterized protein n=1 Tax=Solidesulfovibrio magneticus str. Maddingley MBC34 TaxID=1206767 RepID=K6HA22_9BACT|nr:MAG: hypothetical protein B193_1937 [Solidesulfovibrio magneticus str. Maddingley MBC34]
METYLLKISSDAGVMNGPSKITTFNIKLMTRITKIWTYHFNGGQGRQPGTISLVNLDSGATVGTWQAVGTHHMFDSTPGSIWPSKGDGPPFLYWTAKPGIILAPGRYEVRDSDPASWSCNQETDNRGVAWVYGIVK